MRIIEALRNRMKIAEPPSHSPHCNAQLTPEVIENATNKSRVLERNFIIGCLAIMVLLSIIVEYADLDRDRSIAYAKAQEFVSNKLVSPSSATFPSRSASGITVKYLGKNRYRVAGYLDSKNTFGHKVRSDYECIIRYVGAGEWVCEEIALK